MRDLNKHYLSHKVKDQLVSDLTLLVFYYKNLFNFRQSADCPPDQIQFITKELNSVKSRILKVYDDLPQLWMDSDHRREMRSRGLGEDVIQIIKYPEIPQPDHVESIISPLKLTGIAPAADYYPNGKLAVKTQLITSGEIADVEARLNKHGIVFRKKTVNPRPLSSFIYLKYSDPQLARI